MNTYVAKQQIRLTATFRDLAENLTDPSVVVFKVQDEEGSTTEYTESVRDSLGVYHQDILLSSGGGAWSYRAEGTGIYAGANEKQINVLGSVFE